MDINNLELLLDLLYEFNHTYVLDKDSEAAIDRLIAIVEDIEDEEKKANVESRG